MEQHTDRRDVPPVYSPKDAGPGDTPPSVLFVDDDARVLKTIQRTCNKCHWNILLASSGREGLEIIDREPVDVVVSDMRMPIMGGTEFLEEALARDPHIVAIVMSGYFDIGDTIDAINQGHIYNYLVKPWDDANLKLTIYKALQYKKLGDEQRRLQALTKQQNDELRTLAASLEDQVRARTEKLTETISHVRRGRAEIQNAYSSSVRLFSQLIELRGGTEGHGRRTADLTRRLLDQLAISPAEKDQIITAALLHDIGKVCFNDEQLSLPYAELTSDSQQQVQKHPGLGAAIVMGLKPFKQAARVIRSHHERFDGSGYPDGLSKDEIPLGARVINMVSDCDDLLNRNDVCPREVKNHFKNHAGKLYDPALVGHFLGLLDEIIEQQDLETAARQTNPPGQVVAAASLQALEDHCTVQLLSG